VLQVSFSLDDIPVLFFADHYRFKVVFTVVSFTFLSFFPSWTGINAYVIAFTALASGTSWPDLVASKIAAERQQTADSAIANITCRSLRHSLHSIFRNRSHVIITS